MTFRSLFILAIASISLNAMAQSDADSIHLSIKLEQTIPVFESCAHIDGDQSEQQVCFNRFVMNHLMNEIQWPDGLVENGKVYVEILFDEVGKITSVESLRSYNDLARDEALRVLRTLPDAVQPGTTQGKVAPFKCTIPVMFTR